MPEPVIYTPLGTDLSPPVTFAQYRINDETWRGCRDRTPLYGDADFSQQSRLQTNPIILWQNTGTFAHMFSEITQILIHVYPSLTLGDLMSIGRA